MARVIQLDIQYMGIEECHSFNAESSSRMVSCTDRCGRCLDLIVGLLQAYKVRMV